MELAQDHVHWQALALTMLNLWVLLPKRQLYFGDIGCGGDRCMELAQDRVHW